MKRFPRLGVASLIAVGLLTVVSLGPLVRPEAERATQLTRAPDRGAFLGLGANPLLAGSVASLQARVRAVPEDWMASAALGLAYVQQGRVTGDPSYYPKAEALLQASIDAEPDNGDALIGLAALASARHDFHRALRYAKRARESDPHDANVHGVVGDALVEIGHYDEAFKSFQTMINIRPDTASLSRASYAFELQGERAAAIAAMRRAREYAGNPGDAAWTSYQLGELYLATGRVEEAGRVFRYGWQIDEGTVQSLAGLAEVHLARGDVRSAIAKMQEVVERFPTPGYVIALGDLHTLEGDTDAAERQYDLARAEADLFRDAGVNVDLEIALFFADHGDPERALAAAEAEWAKRKSIHVADALAWALHVNGRDEEAARYARRALSLGTKEGQFLYHAGMIELDRGNPDEARSYLREALEVDPWFSILGVPEAHRILARLEGGR